MDPSDISFGFYMYDTKVTNLFYHSPTLIYLHRVTTLHMIEHCYQHLYDCSGLPTLVWLHSITKTDMFVQDYEHWHTCTRYQLQAKEKEEKLFPITVRVGSQHDSLTRPMW